MIKNALRGMKSGRASVSREIREIYVNVNDIPGYREMVWNTSIYKHNCDNDIYVSVTNSLSRLKGDSRYQAQLEKNVTTTISIRLHNYSGNSEE